MMMKSFTAGDALADAMARNYFILWPIMPFNGPDDVRKCLFDAYYRGILLLTGDDILHSRAKPPRKGIYLSVADCREAALRIADIVFYNQAGR